METISLALLRRIAALPAVASGWPLIHTVKVLPLRVAAMWCHVFSARLVVPLRFTARLLAPS